MLQRFANILCVFFLLFGIPYSANAESQWSRLPSTPSLPKAKETGFVAVRDGRIWYAVYGQGKPVILLHGGLANSNYWGNQVPELAKHYMVIVMDSRGHGRSTNKGKQISYSLMASDVIGLMDFLKIKQAAVVGWSDGANIGLDLAIHHPKRLTKLFAFAGNARVSGQADISESVVFKAYVVRAKTEYESLSPTPKQLEDFLLQMKKMWETQPNFSKEQLHSIKVPTLIVGADHDEGIKREETEYLAASIPRAGLLILPWVNHFAFLQNPQQFTNAVLQFLENDSI